MMCQKTCLRVRPREKPASASPLSKLSNAPRAVRYIRGNVTIATARIDAGHVMMTRTPKSSSRNAPSGRFGLSDASRK